MTCTSCGTRNDESQKYCRGCGARLAEAPASRAHSDNLPEQNPRLSMVERMLAEQRAGSNGSRDAAHGHASPPASPISDAKIPADLDAESAEQLALLLERLRVLTEQNDALEAVQNKTQLRERLRVLTKQNKADATLQNDLVSEDQHDEAAAAEQRKLVQARLHMLIKQNKNDSASASQ